MSSGRIMSSALTWSRTNSVIGVSTKPGHSATFLIPSRVELLVHRLRVADHARLGGRVDRQERLPGLAGDRGEVDHDGVAVLAAGGAQHLGALAVEEDDRAQVDGELEVDALGLVLVDGRAGADAGVVDQHVEAAEALLVGGDHALDVLLGGHVARDLLDLVAGPAQLLGGGGELLGAAGGDGERVALLTEHLCDGEADPAGGSGDDGGAVGHAVILSLVRRLRAVQSTVSRGMQTPLVVMAVLGAALFGLWALTGTATSSEPLPPPRAAPVPVIAERVETLRGLRFDDGAEGRGGDAGAGAREGLEDLDRTYPQARRRADEEMLKLLGLVEPDVDLRDISASVFSQGVAGYYDPRTKRLRTVRGRGDRHARAERDGARARAHARAGGPALRTRRPEELSGDDDAALARLALIEGTRHGADVPLRGRALHGRRRRSAGCSGAPSRTPGRCRRSCRRS